ncbi:GNAT family N-acetyltransferase [Streptomyces sp. NPDC088747]|uniref:GNAT family N-acetyltransferase n=1 Tax=Streptomyces sp. NPDC088747 TaxID=3365886 RepID=UPI0038301299
MNPTKTSTTVIRMYGASQTEPLVDALADVWVDAHPEATDELRQEEDSPVGAFRRQIAGHFRHSGFSLSAAYNADTLVGFAYGFPCSPEYWYGAELLPRINAKAKEGRLMGLCELAVRPGWQGRGIGTQLHEQLIRAIAPDWSSLLVRPDNPRGRALYTRLGYAYAGEYRNTPGGPTYDLLLLSVTGLPDKSGQASND